jgi:acetyltransferase-like isoleucine patch superfamily enzyme
MHSSPLRSVLRALRNAWLDWRTWRWLLRLRFELRRNGGRLKVEGWRGVRMAERPRIRATPLGDGRAVTTIRLSPGVMVGYNVIVEIGARGDNLLELGSGVHVYDGVRLDLRDGSIRLGERCLIHGNAVLKSNGELALGEAVRVSFGSCIHCDQRIEIGRSTGLAELVSVLDSDHTADGSDTPVLSQPIESEPVLIDENVFVSRGSVVLRGARLGKNSLVAANSVVRRGEYPPRSLLAGAPAKLVRQLGPSS